MATALPPVQILTDSATEATQKAILREAFRILRGQTILLPTKGHLAAMEHSRNLLLDELKDTVELLHSVIHEVEISGRAQMPDTRLRVERWKKIVAEQEAL